MPRWRRPVRAEMTPVEPDPVSTGEGMSAHGLTYLPYGPCLRHRLKGIFVQSTAFSPATAAAALPIRDQVVLVTGGARGLGPALVQSFLREGARVVINYRGSADAARETADAFPKRAVAIRADVRDAEQVTAWSRKRQCILAHPLAPSSTMRSLISPLTGMPDRMLTR